MNNFEDPKTEADIEKIPVHKMVFYKNGRVMCIKEVESLVPSQTLMANAERQYPREFEEADSVQPLDPNILKN